MDECIKGCEHDRDVAACGSWPVWAEERWSLLVVNAPPGSWVPVMPPVGVQRCSFAWWPGCREARIVTRGWLPGRYV